MLAAIERIVNAEAEASRAPRKPEITPLDRYASVKNDLKATGRVADAFRSYFPPERVQETQPTTASEDFGSFGTGWHVPSVFWFVGGNDPNKYAKARMTGNIADLPTNHNPRFAPVIHPTLEAGVQALVVASASVAETMNLTPANTQQVVNTLLVAFDLAGTFVFALSGADSRSQAQTRRVWHPGLSLCRRELRAESPATS